MPNNIDTTTWRIHMNPHGPYAKAECLRCAWDWEDEPIYLLGAMELHDHFTHDQPDHLPTATDQSRSEAPS